jgi:hypothetical protein
MDIPPWSQNVENVDITMENVRNITSSFLNVTSLGIRNSGSASPGSLQLSVGIVRRNYLFNPQCILTEIEKIALCFEFLSLVNLQFYSAPRWPEQQLQQSATNGYARFGRSGAKRRGNHGPQLHRRRQHQVSQSWNCRGGIPYSLGEFLCVTTIRATYPYCSLVIVITACTPIRRYV